MPPRFSAGRPIFRNGLPLFGTCHCCCRVFCQGCSGRSAYQYEVEIDGYGTSVLTYTAGCQWRYQVATTTCGQLASVLFTDSISTSCTGRPSSAIGNMEILAEIDFGPSAARDLRIVAPVCISTCDHLATLNQEVTFYLCLAGIGGTCNINPTSPIPGHIRRI